MFYSNFKGSCVFKFQQYEVKIMTYDKDVCLLNSDKNGLSIIGRVVKTQSPYLNLTWRQRSLCPELPWGTLLLTIEAGRLNTISEEDRVCLLSSFGGTENKINFMFCCPVYDDLQFRKMSLGNIDFFWLDDHEKCIFCDRKRNFCHSSLYLQSLRMEARCVVLLG